MGIGAITSYIDVAQLVLYAFWIFFFGLLIYLRREDKREGYPLETDDVRQRVSVEGFPSMPEPKTFRLASGEEVLAPRPVPEPELHAKPVAPWSGAPLEPTGDPLADGVGPASYALRAESPDVTIDGEPRIVPMRVATDFHVDERDPELRGMAVYGADGYRAGTVRDLWVDRAEPMIRFVEITTSAKFGDERNILMPIHSAIIDATGSRILVPQVLASQLAAAPGLATPDQVTLREEERAMGYFAGGGLYASPERGDPLI